MSALVLDGKALAAKTEAELLARVERLKAKSGGKTPILATILVGDDPASATYVKMKGNACRRVGMASLAVEMPASTTTAELLGKIGELNNDPDVHGILLQHPVPAQIDERACFDAIALHKDVDGVTCLGFGRMAMGEEAYGCATPQGIMRILEHYGIAIEGKHAVVVGRSPILGKPMAMMLLQKNATVTICHSRTRDLPGHCRPGGYSRRSSGQAGVHQGSLGERRRCCDRCWLPPGRGGRYRARCAAGQGLCLYACAWWRGADDHQYIDHAERYVG